MFCCCWFLGTNLLLAGRDEEACSFSINLRLLLLLADRRNWVTEEIRLTFAVSQSATVNEEMVGVARMCMKGEREREEEMKEG